MSLVELMVVISVIGIITAIALPNLDNLSTHAHYAKNERNAQTIASMIAAARGVGLTNTWADADEVIDDLVEGVAVPGPAGAMQFKISPLSESERLGVASYLEVTNGEVIYRLAAK